MSAAALKLAMAQVIARKILKNPRKFSKALVQAATDFVSYQVSEYWNNPRHIQRWETSSNSWKRVIKYQSEWEGKL